MASAQNSKNALLMTAVLSFCVVCEITLCTSFQIFWRRNLVTCLLPANFCLQTISIHCLLHPQPHVFIRKTLRLIWRGETHDLIGHILRLSIKHRVLGCCHCCGKSIHDWTEFSLLKRKVPVPWRLKACNRGLSLFRLWGQFLVESPFGCPLKQFTGMRLSLFLPAGLPLPACFALLFSFLLILQKSTDDAQGEF